MRNDPLAPRPDNPTMTTKQTINVNGKRRGISIAASHQALRKDCEEDYTVFLNTKRHACGNFGFEPKWMPDAMFPFQQALLQWAQLKGRAAIFADCGLGKTIIQLTWAENVSRHTGGRVLLLTPLAVGRQTATEATKWGMGVSRSRDGTPGPERITVTNYERLHLFNPDDFQGIVCDESSILKNVDGVTRVAVTTFAQKMPYRLLCTATAAPNDYIELGTSSEALGHMGFRDMLSMFFKKTETTLSRRQEYRHGVWRFRGHAERDFWRWVCSWARALRRPSDLGFDDGSYVLPPLHVLHHVVTCKAQRDGLLFSLPAHTLREQREERSRSVVERCQKAAETIAGTKSAIAWGYLVRECNLLAQMIPDSVEISGDDPEERKEEVFEAFESGAIPHLVTKPTIAGHGLNWQHCNVQTFFPSHSFEQYYQAVRRSWRFGQTKPVFVHIISSEGESRIAGNLARKAEASDKMFDQLVALMNEELNVASHKTQTTTKEIPTWMTAS